MGHAMGEDKTVMSGYTVNEVVGSLDLEALRRTLETTCDAVVFKVDASSAYPISSTT